MMTVPAHPAEREGISFRRRVRGGWWGGWRMGGSDQHPPYYLDEFTFRFNRQNSKARGMLFYRQLQQAVDTDPHPLKDLIGGG